MDSNCNLHNIAQDNDQFLIEQAVTDSKIVVQEFLRSLKLPAHLDRALADRIAEEGEGVARLREVARKCIYKTCRIASIVKIAKENIEFANREIERKSYKASMIADAMEITTTRAEMFSEPTPHETERTAAEAQTLSAAALITRLQLVCAKEYLEENERLLEAATTIVDILYKLCALVIGNLMRIIDEGSLLRAKEIEQVLSSIEEVEANHLRLFAPYHQ